jgi:hypothetical protein
MRQKAVVEKHRKEIMNQAAIIIAIAATFPGLTPSTVLHTLAPFVGPKSFNGFDTGSLVN